MIRCEKPASLTDYLISSLRLYCSKITLTEKIDLTENLVSPLADDHLQKDLGLLVFNRSEIKQLVLDNEPNGPRYKQAVSNLQPTLSSYAN
jgi:hypothetical protein